MSPALIKGLIAAGGIGLGGVGIWQLSEHMAPRTLGDKLKLEGLALLSLDGDGQIGEWKKRAKKHKDNSGSDNHTQNKFSDLQLTGESENDADGKKLRDKCKLTSGKELGQQDQDLDMARLKAWCVVQGEVSAAATP